MDSLSSALIFIAALQATLLVMVWAFAGGRSSKDFTPGNAGIQSASSDAQLPTDYYEKMSSKADIARQKGKTAEALAILQEIREMYPQYNAETENQIRETIKSAFAFIDEMDEEISGDRPGVSDNSAYVNSFYNDSVSALRFIMNMKTDEQYIHTASEKMNKCYISWMNYNNRIHNFWGMNGAFELAAICEEFDSSGHHLASLNGACCGYYQSMIHSGKSEQAYRDIRKHQAELADYSDTIDITAYDSLRQQALDQWKTDERNRYITQVNQYRSESGLRNLDYNTEIEAAADSLLHSFDKWDDNDYVCSVISDFYADWEHAWWVSHRQYESAASALAEYKDDKDSYIYLEDPTQIGVGLAFDEATMRFDWAVIVLY